MSYAAVDDIPPAYDRRRNRRTSLYLSVQVDAGSLPRTGKLKELSRTGAKLEVASPLAVNNLIILSRAGVELPARVVWSKGQIAGLEFAFPLPEENFLARE